MDNDMRRMQKIRAEEISRLLSGGRPTRVLTASILRLVESVERPGDAASEPSPGPAAGARQVLKPKKRVAVEVVQDGLW